MIKPVGSNESSFAKKAIAAVGVAAVAGSAIYALKKGQLPDAFEGGKAKQVAAKMGDGYKKLGSAIASKATAGLNFVKEKAVELGNKISAKLHPAQEAAQEVVQEAAETVAENI